MLYMFFHRISAFRSFFRWTARLSNIVLNIFDAWCFRYRLWIQTWLKIVHTAHIILTQYCFIFRIGQILYTPVEYFRVREKLRFKTGCALVTLRKILIRNTDAWLFCFFFCHFSKCKDLELVIQESEMTFLQWSPLYILFLRWALIGHLTPTNEILRRVISLSLPVR